MNKPSVNPYERPPGSSFEWPRDSFEWPKEQELTTEEKLEKERKLSERQKEVIESYKYAVNLANYHTWIESKAQVFTNEKYNEFLSLPHYAFGDSNLFLDRLRTPELNNLPLNNPPKKESINIAEKPHTPKEVLSEKEKVTEYAVLSNLAYATYEKVNKNWWVNISNLKVKEVNLDIASIDFTKFKIESNGQLSAIDKSKITPDENFILLSFNNQNNYQETWKTIITDTDDKNIADIVNVALFKSKQELNSLQRINLADNSTVISDLRKEYINTKNNEREVQRIEKFAEFIQNNRPKLNEALVRLKESKTSEYQQQFDSLKGFEILAHYPEEWSNDKSGFQCVLFEKDGKKILSIAGTQLNSVINADWKDIWADIDLFNWKIPETQVKAMIDFFRNNLNGNEKVVIVGHSLGGALAQIWTTIYDSSETYTFNSPGAKELKVSIKEWDPYEKELRDFTNNRNSDTIAEKITNVKWIKWFNAISDLWVDIWEYRIDINTSYHSITKILETIEKVDRLVRYKLWWKNERNDGHRIK